MLLTFRFCLLLPVTLLAAVGGACRSNVAPSPTYADLGPRMSADLAQPLPAPTDYTFDFSGSLNGGLKVGNSVNVALSFDRRAPERRYAIPKYSNYIKEPGLFVSNDLSSVCGRAPVSSEDLPPVDAEYIESVDVDMMPGTDRDTYVDAGHRTPGKGWQCDSGMSTVVDPAAEIRRAHLVVAKGPADGLKLYIHADTMIIQRIVVHTRAP